MIEKYPNREDVRSKCIGTRLKPSEFNDFDRLALSKGYSMSGYLRKIILDSINDNAEAITAPMSQDEEQ